jgi:aryl-alcohol dehydrogenase-like predicted oxidoreductase
VVGQAPSGSTGRDRPPRIPPPPRNFRKSIPRLQGENAKHNLALVAAIGEIAERAGRTPAQLSLAWLLSRGEDVIPIPGTKRLRYLEENAAAADITLTPAQLDALERAVPADAVRGARYRDMSGIER